MIKKFYILKIEYPMGGKMRQMKMFVKSLLFLLLLFFNQYFAQHNIDYTIRVWHLGDLIADTITTGSTTEGNSITIPNYDLRGDIANYQSLYNILVNSPFAIQSGALDEDIDITINILGFNTTTEGQYFNSNLFMFMGIGVTGANTGRHGINDTYQLNNGKIATFKIPITSSFLNLLQNMRMDSTEIGFAYYANSAFDQSGISFTNTGDYIVVRLTHFSKFGGGRNSALPVELTEFNVTANNNKVILNWVTATELNNFGFDVERKILGESSNFQIEKWTKIGFVAGHGNSNSSHNYFYTDNLDDASTLVYDNPIYYRLKQIDFDGHSEYSEIKSIKLNSPTKLTLDQNFPNPFNPETIIEFTIPGGGKEKINAQLTVFDNLGREVVILFKGAIIPGKYSVNFNGSNLPSGIYFYTLQAGDMQLTRKMILMK